MLFLAAPLFFFPHYSVTYSATFEQFAAPALSLFSDVKGNAYAFSIEGGRTYLNKVDGDGHLIYHVAPVSGAFAGNATGIADPDGNAYVAVVSFCETNPCVPADEGATAAYAVKLDPAGNIVYRFYLMTGVAWGVALGTDGSAYFTGGAYPGGQFVTTPGVWGPTASAAGISYNAYVVKLSTAGELVYSTFLDNGIPPPSPQDYYSEGRSIAVDALGAVYIAGTTGNPNFPVTAGAFETQCGCSNGLHSLFLFKLSPDGRSRTYAAFLTKGAPRTSYSDSPNAVRIDSAGNATIMISSNLPAKITVQNLNADATALISDVSTVLTGATLAPPITNDGDRILVTGTTNTSGEFPLTDGSLSQSGSTFAMILGAAGDVLYSTRLPYNSGGAGIAPDGSGGFIVLGASRSLPSWILTRLILDTQRRVAVLGVSNIAGFDLGAKLVPGEIVSIYGTNLGPSQPTLAAFDVSGHLPFAVAGTQVYFNGVAAALLEVGSERVNAVVPFALPDAASVAVGVGVNGVLSNTVELPSGAVQPQILVSTTNPFFNQYFALALNEDGAVNSAENPAHLGSVMAVFINGAGRLMPAPDDGAPGRIGENLVAPISALIYNNHHRSPVEIVYAGAAPGEVAGLVQVNLRIPPDFQLNGVTFLNIDVGGDQTSALIALR